MCLAEHTPFNNNHTVCINMKRVSNRRFVVLERRKNTHFTHTHTGTHAQQDHLRCEWKSQEFQYFGYELRLAKVFNENLNSGPLSPFHSFFLEWRSIFPFPHFSFYCQIKQKPIQRMRNEKHLYAVRTSYRAYITHVYMARNEIRTTKKEQKSIYLVTIRFIWVHNAKSRFLIKCRWWRRTKTTTTTTTAMAKNGKTRDEDDDEERSEVENLIEKCARFSRVDGFFTRQIATAEMASAAAPTQWVSAARVCVCVCAIKQEKTNRQGQIAHLHPHVWRGVCMYTRICKHWDWTMGDRQTISTSAFAANVMHGEQNDRTLYICRKTKNGKI